MLYAPPPANLESLYRFNPPSAGTAVAAAASGTATGGVLLNLVTRKDEYGRSASTAVDPQVALRPPSQSHVQSSKLNLLRVFQ